MTQETGKLNQKKILIDECSIREGDKNLQRVRGL